MLQAPSSLSRICGHSHFKKFWLMQTQKEAQAAIGCEKSANLVKSSSHCLSNSPGSGLDSKHDSRWGSGAPSIKALLRDGPSKQNSSNGSGGGTHVSIVACAESLASPMHTESYCRWLQQKRPSLSVKDPNNKQKDSFLKPSSAECSGGILVRDSSAVNGGTCIMSSSTGSPRRQPNIPFEDNHKRPDPSCSLNPCPDEFGNSGGHQILVREPDATKYQRILYTPREKEHFDFAGDAFRLPKESVTGFISFDNCPNPKDFRKFSRGQEFIMPCQKPTTWSEVDRGRGKNSLLEDADYDLEEGSEDGTLEDGKLQDLGRLDSSGRSSLRTCLHCGATKTPLWRSGPHGPKSLCNACGIRFKKSRRYVSFVTEGLVSSATPNPSRSVMKSLKRKQESLEESDVAAVLPHNIQKRSRWPIRLSLKRDCLLHQTGDMTGTESHLNLTVHPPVSEMFSPRPRFKLDLKDPKRIKEELNLARMFARDEDEEAAVLLMALSCGLVNA